MFKRYSIVIVGVILFGMLSSGWAATPINLRHQPAAVLQSFVSAKTGLRGGEMASNLQQISRDVDFNQTTHIRLQQLYGNYPVWGSDIVMHVPKSSKMAMNGVVYQKLYEDLSDVSPSVISETQANMALQHAIQLYQNKTGNQQTVSQTKTQAMIYVDGEHKAHWVFYIQFRVKPLHAMTAKPTYLIDATTFAVYREWDDIKTVETVSGGGFGGNLKMGKLVYDGLKDNFPSFKVKRDAKLNMCFLENQDVVVTDVRYNDVIVGFKCGEFNEQHGKIYWDAAQDAINGAYSPSNDALHAGNIVKEMYQKWYGVSALVKNGKPMLLVMRVHENQPDGTPLDNAYWDGETMTFGDGSYFYPLVSLGISAHEISHGFTAQHSNLLYEGQSGGLDESFSDMAAQAAEFYSTGQNSWTIGGEITKEKDAVLRYMDDPSKDCGLNKTAQRCSISHIKDYRDDLDVHESSGLFNRIFYLLGTTRGWDTKKAFDVMVKANMHYWTSTTTFVEAACGVVLATKDYGYSLSAVTKAMETVGIDVSQC